MFNKSLTVTLFLTLFITSCTVGPKYVKPTVKAPETFRGGAATTAPPAETPESIADLKWFEVFKDEKLQELIKTALQNNYDLREATARIEAAQANLGITRADQLPNVQGGANVVNSRSSSNGQLPAGQLGSGFRDRQYGGVFLNLLSFELDIWGRARRATQAARADLLYSEESRKAITTTIVGDVASSYFNLLELDQELSIAKSTLATRENSLQLTKVRSQGGVSTDLDVRQAEQLVFGAAQQVPDIERRIEQMENYLSLLTGKAPGAIERGRKLTEQEQLPAIPAGLPSALLDRRPDIRAAEQSLIAANARIGVAKAAYFPQISLTGLAGFQSTQLSNLFSGSRGMWNFAPQVTQPIFMGGRLKSGVKLAEAEKKSSLIQYEKTIQTSFREVSDALIEYQKVKEIRTQQESLVASLTERSRLAYLRYNGGVDTQLNALDADRDLFNAQLNLAQTRRNELISVVQLYKALGGGWQN